MQERLVKIAKKLKKNNVAVDVVSFGAEVENKVFFHLPQAGAICVCQSCTLTASSTQLHALRSNHPMP